MESGVKLDSFDHIGVVVKDRDATIKSWTSIFGAEPWTTRDSPVLKMAWCNLGTAQFELLQPTEDKSLWARFLKERGEGIHHVCERAPDIEVAISGLESHGGKVLISTPGVFAYVEIGGPGSIILELLKSPVKK
jgi:methylmalonyl-CoA/ethylmalonyl-CoA epimerase